MTYFAYYRYLQQFHISPPIKMVMMTHYGYRKESYVFCITLVTLHAIVMLSTPLVIRLRLLIRNGLRNKMSAQIKEIKYSSV